MVVNGGKMEQIRNGAGLICFDELGIAKNYRNSPKHFKLQQVMEKKERWVKVSELMEGAYGFSIRVDQINKKKTWVLENNRREAVAHQLVEEGKPPFQNTLCLLAVPAETGDENSVVDVIAFWLKADQ